MTDVKQLIAGKTIAQWQEFAREDDCLTRMVPSDLRQILIIARAHLEALKQKPAAIIYNDNDGCGMAAISLEILRTPDQYSTPVYTAPVPQEKPTVKLPINQKYTFNHGYSDGWNSCLEWINENNPQIKFEVQE